MRLGDEVAALLRERIYAGHYALGAPLRQEELAEDLQVSRTPLREAIRVLEAEGLLSSAPNRTVRVVSADMATFRAAYELREVLDGLAARLAAESDDTEGKTALHGHIEVQRRALEPFDGRAYTAANVAFHAAVFALAANPYLTAQLSLVRMTSQVFQPVKLLAPDRAQVAVSQHETITAAIEAGDGEAAEQAARAHIRSTITRISEES
jgi:DNA-binding GntR family transcriptional regulator